VRVLNIYSQPRIHIQVDPWNLYVKQSFVFHQDDVFTARILPTLPRTLEESPGRLSQTTVEPQTGRKRYSQDFRKLIPKHFMGGGKHDSRSSQSQLNASHGDLDCSGCVESESSSPHKYLPFESRNEIRLLSLFPGDNGTPLRGTVFHTSLKRAPPYMALSYVWGSTDDLRNLSTPDGVISITSSLYSTLDKIRDTEESILLWVDSLCIDQEDPKEKAHQIRLLPEVFRSASCVIAYLGDERDNSDIALQTLMQIRAKEAGVIDWPDGLPPLPASWASNNIPPPRDRVWRDIGALFSRRCFQRSWYVALQLRPL
jgi:hypothetical protein